MGTILESIDAGTFGLFGETRREKGRTHFTESLTFILQGVSHPELALLADWACNEDGNLHTSQISHLRNAKMRMLGVKSLDAIGRINLAAFAYKTDRGGIFRQMGTAITTARVEEILARYEPLLHPVTGQPLDAGDLMNLYLGYLSIALPISHELQVDQATVLAAAIGPWAERMIEDRGLRFREAVSRIRSEWTGDKAGVDRFCGVVAGMSEYSAADLITDWSAITAALGQLIDEELDPAALAEMVSTQSQP